MSQSDKKWYITQQTFPALLHRNVTEFGNRRAQWWKTENGTESLTYAELGKRVRRMSCGLISSGIQKGDRVAIMARTCPEWMQADYAILCAGAITVCIYPTLSAEELAYIVNDSGSKAIFVHDSEILDRLLSVKDLMPELESIILFNGSVAGTDEILALPGLSAMGEKFDAENPGEWEKRWRSVEPGDRMTIVYTSGTTGKPKGAVHTHFSINAACRRDMYIVPELTEEDVMLSFLPLAHTYERECGHGVAMHAALTIAYSSPQTLVQDLQVFRPTLFMSVPRIYERIYMSMKEKASQSAFKRKIFKAAMATGLAVINERADADGFIDMSENKDLLYGVSTGLKLKYRIFDKLLFSKVRELLGGRFRFAFSAAGSLPADLCKTFMAMGVRIFEGYGATETCNTVNLNSPSKILPGSVGSPCGGVTGRIALDGEWQVKGDNLFLEYWNNEEATREAFTEDGFYKTGDIVETVAGNHIKIVDRKKGLLVLDTGKNIASSKIECQYALSPYIDSVVAIGSNKKYIAAIVIPDFDAIIAHMDENELDYDSSQLIYQDGICLETGQDLTDNPQVRSLIDSEIRKANKALESYEKIQKYHISNRKLTEASGELTPTFKIKRNVVLDNFATEIEQLYC